MSDPELIAMRDPSQSLSARMKADQEKRDLAKRVSDLERSVDALRYILQSKGVIDGTL